MPTVKAYGAKSASSPLEEMTIDRRLPSADDIAIDIDYCGVCHSDIHQTRDEWGFGPPFPLVPGHEIIGHITAVGSNVSNFKVGDQVGVGCLVDSCKHCKGCDKHLEQHCPGKVATYGGKDPKYDSITQGGYSQHIVVDKNFVLNIPDNLDPAEAAPLLCAGITTWSPLKQWNVSAGDRVGVIGLGGLGHMGVKLAKALGAHVTMITTSQTKADDAKKLGADNVLISKDAEAMKQAKGTFDFLLNTIPVDHDFNPYLALLDFDGTMVFVGVIEPLTHGFSGAELILNRKKIAGSLIGGIEETQEMLDFCGKHNITSDIELINIKDINQAYERTIKSDVKYRFVIDLNSLKQGEELE
jgi:uncharacterized zinc-type alcohol dehydrogenase-like protein